MPETELNREEDLRQLLTDAIEVQLAALRAGISFWTEWIEHTSTFVQSATKTLSSIASDDQASRDVLLELVDAGRASVRSLTEIPRHTAAKFIEELDKLKTETGGSTKGSPRTAAGQRARTGAPRRKRAGRAKA